METTTDGNTTFRDEEFMQLVQKTSYTTAAEEKSASVCLHKQVGLFLPMDRDGEDRYISS